MEKLLLTFVFFISISFTGLQAEEINENIALNSEIIELNSEQSQTLFESDMSCAEQWSMNVDALMNSGYGMYTSFAIADRDFEDCLDERYGE